MAFLVIFGFFTEYKKDLLPSEPDVTREEPKLVQKYAREFV